MKHVEKGTPTSCELDAQILQYLWLQILMEIL